MQYIKHKHTVWCRYINCYYNIYIIVPGILIYVPNKLPQSSHCLKKKKQKIILHVVFILAFNLICSHILKMFHVTIIIKGAFFLFFFKKVLYYNYLFIFQKVYMCGNSIILIVLYISTEVFKYFGVILSATTILQNI